MLVQTFTPEHPCIALAAAARLPRRSPPAELGHRQQHNYPPYQRLARLIVRSKDEKAAGEFADRLAAAFEQRSERRKQTASRRAAPARPGRGAGVSAEGLLSLSLPAAVAELGATCTRCCGRCCRRVRPPHGVELTVDVDPQDML